MSVIRRIRWAVPLVMVLTALLVGVTGTPASASLTRTYSYENGFSGWQVGYAGDGAWSMTRSTDQA